MIHSLAPGHGRLSKYRVARRLAEFIPDPRLSCWAGDEERPRLARDRRLPGGGIRKRAFAKRLIFLYSVLMPLASDPLPRDTMNLLAAVTSNRRARNPHARRDWMRISQRLACGLTPRQVATAERTDEAAIDTLLAQAGFRALVAAYEDFLALPPSDAMAQLVKLARLALENALCDHDVGAALFVLREDKLHRDAAHALAKKVLATSRRKHGTAAPPSPAPTPPETRPYEPGPRLLARGAARLRRAVIEEHAAHKAASTEFGAAATVAAAHEALAAKANATISPASQLACRLRYGTGLAVPTPSNAPLRQPLASAQPRRPRPP